MTGYLWKWLAGGNPGFQAAAAPSSFKRFKVSCGSSCKLRPMAFALARVLDFGCLVVLCYFSWRFVLGKRNSSEESKRRLPSAVLCGKLSPASGHLAINHVLNAAQLLWPILPKPWKFPLTHRSKHRGEPQKSQGDSSRVLFKHGWHNCAIRIELRQTNQENLSKL